MSGPIIRKYGFPNFENIFGVREIQHGASEKSSNVSVNDSKKPESAHHGSPPGADATEAERQSEDSAKL